MKICKQCGQEFDPGMHGDRQLFCCGLCNSRYKSNKAKRKRRAQPKPPKMVECKNCGKTFEWSNGGTLHCSVECRQDYSRMESRKIKPPKACHVCGVPMGKNCRGRTKTCGDPLCQEIVTKDRRCRTSKGAGLQRVADLYVKQGYRCAGCGWPVPIHSLSLDHIIPRIKGGSFTSDFNQQLLCLRCNSDKADRPMSVVYHDLMTRGQVWQKKIPKSTEILMVESLRQYMRKYRLPHHRPLV